MKFKKYLYKPLWQFDSKTQKETIQYKPDLMNSLADFYIFKDSSNKMSRVLQYKDIGCMIISAERHNKNDKLSDEENLKRTKDLEQTLRSLNLGFRPSFGSFGEGEEKISFVIPKPINMEDSEFLNIAIELCKKYNQDSVLIILPSVENGNPVYLTQEGKVDMEFTDLRFKNEDDEYYTRLKKNTSKLFVFYKKDNFGKVYQFIRNNELTISDVSNFYDKYELVNYHPGLLKFKGFDSGTFNSNCDDRFKNTKYEVK